MVKELWQQEAQKLGGDSLVEVIQEIRDSQRDMLERLNEMDKKHTVFDEGIGLLKKAFPSDDVEGHRRYHEAMIERNVEIRRLRVAIQEKTIGGLIWLIILGVSLALWNEFKRSLYR